MKEKGLGTHFGGTRGSMGRTSTSRFAVVGVHGVVLVGVREAHRPLKGGRG